MILVVSCAEVNHSPKQTYYLNLNKMEKGATRKEKRSEHAGKEKFSRRMLKHEH